MATLKAVVRKQRADGFYAVYIRIVHRSRMGYIKTDKVISPKSITASGEFKDPVVNEYCSRQILKYTDMLNRKDLTQYTVAEVIEYLTRDAGVESFSEYARLHIDRMKKSGHARNAKDYWKIAGDIIRDLCKCGALRRNLQRLCGLFLLLCRWCGSFFRQILFRHRYIQPRTICRAAR